MRARTRCCFCVFALDLGDVYASFVSILMRIFSFFISSQFFFFSEIVSFMIDNRTSCGPIQSVIILVINKSDSRCAVVRFCYHSYDYRLNWTPLTPITLLIECSQTTGVFYYGVIHGLGFFISFKI